MIDAAERERLGIFTGEDGGYYRHRVRVRNVRYDPSSPDAEAAGKIVSYDEELIPFPVVLAASTEPDEIARAQQRAAERYADFYHPRYGWLRWGRKPERDHTENLGAGATRYQTRPVTVAPADDDPEPVPAAAPAAAPATKRST